MTKKATKIPTKLLDMVQLVEKDEAKKDLGEAFASFLLNPTVSWAKFILTDDRVNGNGQRIPKEEFANLINTGIHMPVKMALGEIAPGHDDSKPLGVITHLKEITTEDGSSAVEALAALWGEERPADVSFIKERHAQNQPVDISWEILYEDELFNETLGSIDLISTVLKAATVVGNPAYQGRTPFLAISSKKAKADEESHSEEITEDNTVELEQLKAELAAAQAKLDEQKTALETAIAEKDAEIARLTEQNTALTTEIEPLRTFKSEADALTAKAEKVSGIKAKFVEAGLSKDDEYFTTNEENLLKLDEAQLDFMVQELKTMATAKTSEASNEDKTKTKVPPIHSENTGDVSLKDMAAFLRESKGKK